MVYNSIIEALAKLGGIKDWTWIHVKVGMPGDKRHEIFFSNPDYAPVVEQSEPAQPAIPVKQETLEEKVQRMRNAKSGELTSEEEAWFKERQRELEVNKIGQILPEDSIETVMDKLKKIGVDH